MVCPILPQTDYNAFAQEMIGAIDVAKCEHVWAEPINVRGPSLTKTAAALRAAGYEEQAALLERVSTDKAAWELYAQATFTALAKVVPLSLKTQLAHGEPTAQAYIEKQYQVDGFPALIMLDADGKVVARQPGYMPGQPFADWVNKVVAGRR